MTKARSPRRTGRGKPGHTRPARPDERGAGAPASGGAGSGPGVALGRGAYLIYGLHAGTAALANPARRIGRVWATRQATERAGEMLAARNLRPLALDRAGLDQLVGGDAVHQGLAIETWPLAEPDLETLAPSLGAGARLLLLDQVTDPHNVGAILRSAAVFGVAAVCLQARHAPPESGALAKAASGALEQVPLVRIGNLARALEFLKDTGFWVAGLDGEAEETLETLPRDRPLVLVLGAEGAGLRRLTRETCDMLVRVPMAANAVGSLNVSNAAAVALYAARAPV